MIFVIIAINLFFYRHRNRENGGKMKRHKWVRPKEKKEKGIEVPFTCCGYLISKGTSVPDNHVRFMTIDEFIRESKD